MSREVIRIEGDMPDMPPDNEVPWPPLEVDYPEESKAKPWEQEPAPNATMPQEIREETTRFRSDAPIAYNTTPVKVREASLREALRRAESALREWDQAMDWAEIDDPALPNDYDAVAKGMTDFIQREKARIQHR